MRRILLTTLLLVFAYTLANAQGRGQIKGVVKDAATGEALIGVNVGLVGTSIGAPTDIDGNYIINRVPVGTYMLGASSVGYKKFEIEVTIEAGATLELEINLEQEAVMGEEVVVSAQAQGQREAINQQIQSERIVNVVSETKIQELPDFNAAAALGRLPGVSTTKSSGEDNKVVIRGLSPEYNSIQVEGIKMAATGGTSIGFTSDTFVSTGGVNNDRSVDLTSVSPYMIRMIEVYKSLTPDMNANSIGGTVNMELREAPEGAQYSAMWQQGYTAKNNTLGNYRAVMSASNRFLDNKFGIYALGNIESYDRDSDNFTAGYDVPSTEVDSVTGWRPVRTTSVTFNRHVETRNRLGGNVILDYRLKNGSLKFVNMLTLINRDYDDYNQSISYTNGRMNWRMQQNDNDIRQQLHSLKLDYDLSWMNIDMSVSYTGARNNLKDSPVIQFNQTSAVGIQFEEIFNVVPEDLIYLQPSVDNFETLDNVILRSANLFTSLYKEDILTYKADFEIPFNIGTDVSGAFKFGGQWDHQENSLDQEAPYMGFNGSAAEGEGIQSSMMQALRQEFGIEIDDAGAMTGNSFLNSDSYLFNSFLDNRYGQVFFTPSPGILVDMVNYVIGNPLYDASNEDESIGREGGWYDGPYQQLTNDYSFDEDYLATYAMGKFTWGKLFVIGGVRYEQVESHYKAFVAEDIRNAQTQYMIDTTSTSTNEFLLPMVQGKFDVTDWMDLRYAYTQTLARPRYNDLSPRFTIPNGGGSINTGNPDLQPAQAFNHDLNLTFHANKLGLLSIGAFYKTIQNFRYTARYRLDAAELAGLDQASNYIITCNQSIRDRYAEVYPVLANCQDGLEIVGPTATQGTYQVTVNKPLNNPYDATVKGIEVDFQHNFWYLPGLLNNIVMGINYTRIVSEYQQPAYETGERFVTPDGGGRPQKEFFLIDTVYTTRLSNQPNHVINTYLGYDQKGFSARFSLLVQSSSLGGRNGLQPENSSYTDSYVKLDFTARQKLPWFDNKAQAFMDVSNLNGANTVTRQTSINGASRIENYGLTANLGLRLNF